MQNVKYAVVNGKLLIEIDLKHTCPGPPTKGGNHMCSTSDSWARFEGMPGYSFNMVLVRKPGSAIPDNSPDETMEEVPKIMRMG